MNKKFLYKIIFVPKNGDEVMASDHYSDYASWSTALREEIDKKYEYKHLLHILQVTSINYDDRCPAINLTEEEVNDVIEANKEIYEAIKRRNKTNPSYKWLWRLHFLFYIVCFIPHIVIATLNYIFDFLFCLIEKIENFPINKLCVLSETFNDEVNEAYSKRDAVLLKAQSKNAYRNYKDLLD